MSVIAARFERIEASVGRQMLRGTGILATIGATAECSRMVFEKFDAAAAAHSAGALALVRGRSVEAAAELAMAPVKRRVRANRRRLSRG
jgi:hypothetical protein